ncbi:E3 ubiquitin-protein ligase MARCH6 [Microdochium nivale]|nr:E3 ubiquitin-protein ligase MARCH6 [Microdochium nivale]
MDVERPGTPFFGHTIEHGTTSPTSRLASDNATAEADTCRICRGEAATEEPLFYPCKCSGSIKYVHQDCLMEWLSHSQKKHCELCKTPFRFTKLYSPDMPTRLPFHVFVTHMAKYIFRNVLVWLRATLVVSVWLGWLPYLMRSVWSFLFWISDEGFGPGPAASDLNVNHSGSRAYSLSISGHGSATCPSSPLFDLSTQPTTAAGLGEFRDRLLKALFKPINVASGQTWLMAIVRALFGSNAALVDETTNVPFGGSTPIDTANVTISAVSTVPSSLLSEVGFLRNLTRHAAINRAIITVLEGQIITILVIVCFILIILVRDYVVQQQPELNMRAALAAADDNAPMPPPPGAPHVHNIDHFEAPEVMEDGEEDSEEEYDGEEENESDEEWTTIRDHDQYRALPRRDPSQSRPIAGLRRRSTRQNMQDPLGMQDDMISEAEQLPATEALTIHDDDLRLRAEEDRPQAQEQWQNPQLDYRATSPASLLDNPSPSSVSLYLRIYREAGGDRDRILRKIREEGLEDRLRQWVSITQAMPPLPSPSERDRPLMSTSHAQDSPPTAGSQVPIFGGETNEMSASVSSAWNWSSLETRAASTVNKGKEKEETSGLVDNPPVDSGTANLPWQTFGRQAGEQIAQQINDEGQASPFPFSPTHSGRPRSISDGPQRHETINPLANNNWSFSRTPQLNYAEGATPPVPAFEGFRAAFVSEDRQASSAQHTAESAASDNHEPSEIESVPENWDDDEAASADASEPEIASIPEQGNGGQAPADNGGPRDMPAGLVNRMAAFMWGDVDAEALEDLARENAVDIFGDDQAAPFIDNGPAEINDDDNLDDDLAPDVVEAAGAAGLDPEAIEDQEDFEGIMELIGMRGPLAGLFQNAIFCAFLVSISIFVGIFVPYNIGRVSVWVVANPTRLVRMAFSFSKFVQDCALMVFGFTAAPVFRLLEFWRNMFNIDIGIHALEHINTQATNIAMGAFNRTTTSFLSEFNLITASEMRNFSAISHEALVFVKAEIRYLFMCAGTILDYVFGGDYLNKLATASEVIAYGVPMVLDLLRKAPSLLTDPSSWTISLNITESAATVDQGLASWDANDRTWAILAGYTSFSVAAGLYLGRGTPISSSEATQDWEDWVIDALNQASGVMKVILIISIEMLVFPLYCGMLLDFALLPLFENTTLKSRMLFTYNFPLTSIFVHWFVGTGYMFHFALFVAMCRKIMRKGVLYFIRDPDDPEFHPVRDVLERNVTTQLRKIMFSAFVYGALVIVCLGGVVWGLSLALPDVLPIHYSSNEPVLEFPIDLLFYNFLMPLAVRFFKPSDGLHSMYTWWFRTCARGLRLTWFLFGERQIDEEGKLVPHLNHRLNWWQKLFVEVTPAGDIAPKNWASFFDGGQSTPTAKMTDEKLAELSVKKEALVRSGQLICNGRFVRSPASDQVKITKSQRVFLEVSEQNNRIDDSPDHPEADIYSGVHYQLVYVPPYLRFRIFLFILFIWLFAAVTGVGFTIVPLVFGRLMFKAFIPAHIRTNDIYAFSIGIYVLGSLGYFMLHARSAWHDLAQQTRARWDRLVEQNAIQRGQQIAHQAVRLVYTYMMLLVVFPLLITVVVELYVMMPLQTYISSSDSTRLDGLHEGHTVRVIQAWTLGVLYLKLGSRALTVYGGRPAVAVRAVLRRGWLDPDVDVLTRAFVIPGLACGLVMILGPPVLTKMWLSGLIADVTTDSSGATGPGEAALFITREQSILAYRMAYPITAMLWCALLISRRTMRVLDGWQVRIRDEAYLMGERLHNFGGTAVRSTSSWKGRSRL